MPAPRLVELVDEHLKRFDIDMKKDIVCAVTDGASVMGVFGRLIPCLHLKCMCHAVNLSICDVLYPKKATKRKHDVSKFSKQSHKSQISQQYESSDEEEGGISSEDSNEDGGGEGRNNTMSLKNLNDIPIIFSNF